MIFEIGGIITALEIPNQFIAGEFLPFSFCGKKIPDMRISLHEGNYENNPVPDEGDEALRATAQTIFKKGENTHFLFTDEDCIHAMSSNAGYSECELAAAPSALRDTERVNELARSVFSLTKMLFMGRLALGGGILMHAAAVEYKGGAVVFSAPSGVGKSTHAELWRREFPGEARVINGDNAIVRVIGEEIELFGSPWCGTSGIYENARLPLRGIVLLEQSPENSAHEIPAAEAFMRFSARCFMPMWDGVLVSRSLESAEKIIPRVPCRLLKCRPDAEAVFVIKKSLGI